MRVVVAAEAESAMGRSHLRSERPKRNLQRSDNPRPPGRGLQGGAAMRIAIAGKTTTAISLTNNTNVTIPPVAAHIKTEEVDDAARTAHHNAAPVSAAAGRSGPN